MKIYRNILFLFNFIYLFNRLYDYKEIFGVMVVIFDILYGLRMFFIVFRKNCFILVVMRKVVN